MLNIYQDESEDDRIFVRELFWEYLQWANFNLNQKFDVNFNIELIETYS